MALGVDIQEKLLSNYAQDSNGCWIWLGPRDGDNYGRVRYLGKTLLVHRVSAHLFKGFDLNSPLDVRHKCDNPPCFNPDHLDPGSRSANMRDYYQRGEPRTPKTHCKKGHPYTPENTVRGKAQRHCKVCQRENQQNWYNKRRGREPKGLNK